ncbi:hypothetical protein [Porphyromonas canoris]|nr:hypothetical protein [Porphyromonas canoris]
MENIRPILKNNLYGKNKRIEKKKTQVRLYFHTGKDKKKED